MKRALLVSLLLPSLMEWSLQASVQPRPMFDVTFRATFKLWSF